MLKKKILILLSFYGTMSMAVEFSTKIQVASEMCTALINQNAKLKNDSLNPYETYYERSFDLRYQILDETRYLPSVTIGLQDFIGTGMMQAEYIAATKTFGDKLKVTAGLGWGRLGSYQSIGSAGTRPPVVIGEGGTAHTGQWFKGDIAPFAGFEWQITPKLGFKAEYSSDAYEIESEEYGTSNAPAPTTSALNIRRPTCCGWAPITFTVRNSACLPSSCWTPTSARPAAS